MIAGNKAIASPTMMQAVIGKVSPRPQTDCPVLLEASKPESTVGEGNGWFKDSPVIFVRSNSCLTVQSLGSFLVGTHGLIPTRSSSELIAFSSDQISPHEGFHREKPGRSAPTGAPFVQQNVRFVHHVPHQTLGRCRTHQFHKSSSSILEKD